LLQFITVDALIISSVIVMPGNCIGCVGCSCGCGCCMVSILMCDRLRALRYSSMALIVFCCGVLVLLVLLMNSIVMCDSRRVLRRLRWGY